MLFLQYLSYACLCGVVITIIFALMYERGDTARRARAKALVEATEALQSLADIAGEAALKRQQDGLSNRVAADRAYYLQRAAQIVASIPVDRV